MRKILMLEEDRVKFKKEFSGAEAFLVAAEKRFHTYFKIKKASKDLNHAQTEIVKLLLNNVPCQEGWFVDKLKNEGVSVPDS